MAVDKFIFLAGVQSLNTDLITIRISRRAVTDKGDMSIGTTVDRRDGRAALNPQVDAFMPGQAILFIVSRVRPEAIGNDSILSRPILNEHRAISLGHLGIRRIVNRFDKVGKFTGLPIIAGHSPFKLSHIIAAGQDR